MGLQIAGPPGRNYDRDLGQAGLIVRPPYGSDTAASIAAGFAYYVRFVPSRAMSVVSIGFVVSTAAGANDNCDVGIYTGGNKVVSSGATAGKLNGTGLQTVTVTATPLTAGTVYYAAFSAVTPFGGSAAALQVTTVSQQPSWQLFGASVPQIFAGVQSGAHPLPSSMTIASGGSVPLLVLRES